MKKLFLITQFNILGKVHLVTIFLNARQFGFMFLYPGTIVPNTV